MMNDWDDEMTVELYNKFGTKEFVAREWNSGPFFDKENLLYTLYQRGILSRSPKDQYGDVKYQFKRRYDDIELQYILKHDI